MGKLPSNFESTLQLIASRLAEYNYAVRGTASLVLQNIDMNVEDIDIVGDSEMAIACNAIFEQFIISPVIYSESTKYKSYFGQFKINGILVEVYGDWQIKTPKGDWKQIEVKRNEVNGIFVTTIETELAMFAAMGRWTAFHKIKRQMP